MPRFVIDSIRKLVTDLVPSPTGIQLVPHLVRNLVPRHVPNLVMDLVLYLVPDQMTNLILVVPDLVKSVPDLSERSCLRSCTRSGRRSGTRPEIRSRTSSGTRKRIDLVSDLVPNLLLARLPDLVPCLVHVRYQMVLDPIAASQRTATKGAGGMGEAFRSKICKPYFRKGPCTYLAGHGLGPWAHNDPPLGWFGSWATSGWVPKMFPSMNF